jgi:hypothetical protein
MQAPQGYGGYMDPSQAMGQAGAYPGQHPGQAYPGHGFQQHAPMAQQPYAHPVAASPAAAASVTAARNMVADHLVGAVSAAQAAAAAAAKGGAAGAGGGPGGRKSGLPEWLRQELARKTAEQAAGWYERCRVYEGCKRSALWPFLDKWWSRSKGCTQRLLNAVYGRGSLLTPLHTMRL